MGTVSNFSKIRRDGKLVPEGMTSAQVGLVNNAVVKIIGAQWESAGRQVQFTRKFPVLVEVVAGRNYVAALESTDESQRQSVLNIYSTDGSVHATLPNRIVLERDPVEGTWNWFEKDKNLPDNHLLAAFQSTWSDRTGQTHYSDDFVEVDAETGSIVGVRKGR